jgi:hypothetical protein
VQDEARAAGLGFEALHDMPAHNRLLVFARPSRPLARCRRPHAVERGHRSDWVTMPTRRWRVHDGQVVEVAVRQQRHQLAHMQVGRGRAHRVGHDLPGHLRVQAVAAAAGAQQRAALAQRGRAVQAGVVQEVGQRDDAHHPAAPVQHRQGVDAVLAQRVPGLLQRGAEIQRHHVARHDVAAAHLALQAPEGALLGLVQQLGQVVRVHVQHLVLLAQHGVQVLAGEAQALARRGSRVPWSAAGAGGRCG